MQDFEYEDVTFKTVNARPRRRLNGWRRLWLVLTIFSLVGAFLFSAYVGAQTNNSFSTWEYNRSLQTAINNPGCATFLTNPFNEIVEPDFSTPCYYIYLSRSYDRGAPLPYTMERHKARQSAERWQQFGLALAITFPLVLIVSALVYLAGWLIAWIRRGFQQS